MEHEHKAAKRVKAAKWLMIWIGIAICCNIVVYFLMGKAPALDFFGAYITELSLSIDNVFVFLMIFLGFGISEKAQHRVLAWGIIGAIILRFIFVFFGLVIIERFEWVLYIFGAVLIVSGAKMFKGEEEKDPHDSRVIRIMKKFVPMTTFFEDDKFFTLYKGKKMATPLLAVLVLIESSDILFAIDSVPAVISITRELWIVYISNILAILCLRQLFFVIEHIHEKFEYVKYGVAVILIFTGAKMLAGIAGIHVTTEISIGVIVGVMVISIIISVAVSKNKEKEEKKEQ